MGRTTGGDKTTRLEPRDELAALRAEMTALAEGLAAREVAFKQHLAAQEPALEERWAQREGGGGPRTSGDGARASRGRSHQPGPPPTDSALCTVSGEGPEPPDDAAGAAQRPGASAAGGRSHRIAAEATRRPRSRPPMLTPSSTIRLSTTTVSIAWPAAVVYRGSSTGLSGSCLSDPSRRTMLGGSSATGVREGSTDGQGLVGVSTNSWGIAAGVAMAGHPPIAAVAGISQFHLGVAGTSTTTPASTASRAAPARCSASPA